MGQRRVTVNVKRAAKEYESGRTLKEVANKLGVSASIIRSRLAEHGVKIRPKGLPPKIDAKLLRAMYYDDEMTMGQIADSFGVTRQRIHQIMIYAGIERRGVSLANGRIRMLSKEQIESISEDETLITKTAAAKRLGVSCRTVAVYCRLYGIEIDWQQRRKAYKSKQLDDAVELYLSGNSVPEVSDETGVSRPSIYIELRRRAIPRRPGGPKRRNIDIGKIRKMHKQGKSTRQISNELGVAWITIKIRLAEIEAQDATEANGSV